MLIPEEHADLFLKKYQLIMAYLNEGVMPGGMEEFAALREDVYLAFEDEEDVYKEIAGSSFVDSLKAASFGNFVYLKKYKDGYVFQNIESGRYYRALALTTNLEEFLPEFCVVTTALVPYNDYLVCDGLVFMSNTLLGKNMIKDVRDGYWEAKRNGSLITAIDVAVDSGSNNNVFILESKTKQPRNQEKHENWHEFVGKWRITWMENWDQDYVDYMEPGFFEFTPEGLGAFVFGTVQGDLDVRVSKQEPFLEFSWQGLCEGDLLCGRGKISFPTPMKGEGEIFIHCSDESRFTIERMS